MTNTFTTETKKGNNKATIVSIAGYLDAHTAQKLEDDIQSVIDAGTYRIVVDFSGLEYISSAGLGVFMVFVEQVRDNDGDIKFAGMTPKVYNVFDLLGFPQLFTIVPTIAEAEAAFA